MPVSPRFAAAAAVITVIVAAAIYLAGSRPAVVVVPSLSARPSPTAVGPARPGASPYVLPSIDPEETPHLVTATGASPHYRVDLPVGWRYTGFTALYYGPDEHQGGLVYFRSNPVLEAPCAGVVPRQRPRAGMTSSAIAEALVADPRLTVTPKPAMTLDGRPAQVLDIQLAPTYTGTCGGFTPEALIFGGGSILALEGQQRWRLTLLDVDGIPEVVVIWPKEEADDTFFTRAEALLGSLTFLP